MKAKTLQMMDWKYLLLLIYFFVPSSIYAQKQWIEGKVLDENSEPLIGATVKIVNSPRGVLVDIDGGFKIEASPSERLIISFVGYVEQIVKVGNTKNFTIKMATKASELDEVTVVAFGKQKKESVIGSITTIRPAELKMPSSNLSTALSGRVAGMISYQRTGEPGSDDASFFIRGVTSFGYSVDPLILIDGVETSKTDFARLNVDDIESFSIMKDATSTALYGARGANGVIVITTKEGEEGSVKLSVRYDTRISTSTQDLKLADPITYMKLANEAVLTRDPLAPTRYSTDKIEKTAAGADPYLYPATDWMGDMFKNSTVNHNANVSMSGGSGKTKYFVTGNVKQDNGVLNVPKVSNFNSNIKLLTGQIRSNVNMELTKSTILKVRLSGTFDNYTGPVTSGSDLYARVMRTNPVLYPAYYPRERTSEYQMANHILFGNYGTGGYSNPYAEMVKGYKEYKRSNMYAQIELNQDLNFITKGLKARGLVNITRDSYFDVVRQYKPFYYAATSADEETGLYLLEALNPDKGAEYLDYAEGGKRVSANLYMEFSMSYARTFVKKHDVSTMLVYTVREKLDGNAGSLQSSLPYRNIGLAGRATYGYDKRYFFEANFGYNGSERFSKGNRFGFFPSVGAAWTLSNEDFFADRWKEYVTSLKLRATYGMVGNDAIGNAASRFYFLSEMNMTDGGKGATFGQNFEEAKNGISTLRYANPGISWEVAHKSNLALETTLFKNLNIIAEYYWERRTNILMKRTSIPTTMGLAADMSANIGESSASGVDLSMDYNHVINKNIWAQGRLNFTYATSRREVYEEPIYDEWWMSKVGYSNGQQWGYIADRLFIDDAEVANSPKQFGGDVRGGDIKYHDTNNDGMITELDMVPIGYPTTPKINYGFGVSMGVHNFDFSCFFQGSAQSSFWIDVASTAPFVGERQLLQVYADDHWSEENRNSYALWPRLSSKANPNNEKRSTWFMQNGSFLRLKQVELGYTLPKTWTRRCHMNNLRVYLSCSNVCSWSKFDLWDVEMAGDPFKYPLQRVYNMGVNLTF